MRMWTPWAVGLVLAGTALAAPSGPPAPASSPALAASDGSPVALAVDAGYLHTCAIRMDRTLACWGEHDVGQATPPAGTYVAVSAGVALSCAIRSNGTLACWGYNEHGEAIPPPGMFTAVSTGAGHSCAIRSNGTLACWGENYAGQASPPAGTFTAVSARSDHTCAIRSDGTLACWGYNEFGQTDPPAGTFVAASASGDHTCAIRTDGTLACWGDDENGPGDPARRHLHLGERGIRAHVRDQDRRDARLLGQRLQRPGDPAGRDLRRGQWGRQPHLCHPDRQRAALLGRQRVQSAHAASDAVSRRCRPSSRRPPCRCAGARCRLRSGGLLRGPLPAGRLERGLRTVRDLAIGTTATGVTFPAWPGPYCFRVLARDTAGCAALDAPRPVPRSRSTTAR